MLISTFGVQIGVGADLEAKFPQEKLTDTPCIKVSNKTGSNAYQPANYIMQTLSGDPELRAKKDGSKVRNVPLTSSVCQCTSAHVRSDLLMSRRLTSHLKTLIGTASWRTSAVLTQIGR